MNIIVPMAARGSRLRPHTLTVPKPLVPVAGKPIVERLVEDIVRTAHDGVDNICFVTGEFGEDVERELVAVAERLGAPCSRHRKVGGLPGRQSSRPPSRRSRTSSGLRSRSA